MIHLNDFTCISKLMSYFNSCRFSAYIFVIEKNIKIHKAKKLSLSKLWRHRWKILVHWNMF